MPFRYSSNRRGHKTNLKIMLLGIVSFCQQKLLKNTHIKTFQKSKVRNIIHTYAPMHNKTNIHTEGQYKYWFINACHVTLNKLLLEKHWHSIMNKAKTAISYHFQENYMMTVPLFFIRYFFTLFIIKLHPRHIQYHCVKLSADKHMYRPYIFQMQKKPNKLHVLVQNIVV